MNKASLTQYQDINTLLTDTNENETSGVIEPSLLFYNL